MLYRCFFISLFSVFFCHAAPLTISVESESAILMNAETGSILFEKNAHALQFPASTTKVATALYALKIGEGRLTDRVIATHEAVASETEEAIKRSNYTLPAYRLIPGGSHMGIKKDEELSFRDLLFGLMVVSANDAANVIAMHLSGEVPKFMEGLNSYLQGLGCKKTNFCNPHGLFHPKHQTTAYEMALIMKEAVKHPLFCEIIGTKTYERPKTNKQDIYTLVQTNRMIRKGKYFYPHAIGGKTGYLSVAGNALVVAAKQEGRTLIAVLMKGKTRPEQFKDAAQLFEAAFNQKKLKRTFFKTGPQNFALDMDGAAKQITTYTLEDIALEYYPAEEEKIKCRIYWEPKKLPIAKGEVVGEVRLLGSNERLIKAIKLYSQEEVKSTWSWSLRKLLNL